MSAADRRKLLGGYATGTLTDEERRRLMEAALEDQELFDALQDEQALKELLDQPASREAIRRAAAASPARRLHLWTWAGAAAALAAAAAITIFVVRGPRSEQPAAVAVVRNQPVQPLPAPPQIVEQSPAVAAPAPSRRRPKVARVEQAKPAATPPVEATAQAPAQGPVVVAQAPTPEFRAMETERRAAAAPRAAIAGADANAFLRSAELGAASKPAVSVEPLANDRVRITVTSPYAGPLRITSGDGATVLYPEGSATVLVRAGEPYTVPVEIDAAANPRVIVRVGPNSRDVTLK